MRVLLCRGLNNEKSVFFFFGGGGWGKYLGPCMLPAFCQIPLYYNVADSALACMTIDDTITTSYCTTIV